MLQESLLVVLQSVIPFLLGSVGVWLYYRTKNQELAEALADKNAIVTSLLKHSDEIEKQNVKKVTKEHNKAVAKKEKNPRKKTTKK